MLDQALIDRTKGFLDHQEGMALYEAARACGPLGPGLEIGSYCGKSTLYLGTGFQACGGILFSIDHHRGSEEQQPGQAYCDPDLIDAATGRIDTFGFFRRTLEAGGLEQTVVPIVSASQVAARLWATPLSLIFIDGSHTFEAARADYAAWADHLLPGGYLLIHDIFLDPAAGGQAPRAVYAQACAADCFDDLGLVGTLARLRRR